MLYCLLERSPSEQSQEDQKSEHHPLHVQVKKKTMVPKRAVDICYDRIYHWPEFGDERNRCRVCSMLSFVLYTGLNVKFSFAYKRTGTVSSSFMIDNFC